jgi:hypothetical protein
MEEHQRVASQVLDRNGHNIPRARQAGMSMPYPPFGLKAPGPEPRVCKGKALTAVVGLLVVNANRATVLEDRAILRHSVRNAREKLGQVERGVGVVADPEKQHLPVQIVHPTDRAFGDVGRKRERIGSDPASRGSLRCEGLEMVATPYPGQSPEGIRDDSEVRRRRSGEWVEGLVVVSRPGRHHYRTIGTDRLSESLDQAERPPFHRPRGPEGRVDQQHAPFLDAERTELIDYLGPAQLIPLDLAFHDPRRLLGRCF